MCTFTAAVFETFHLEMNAVTPGVGKFSAINAQQVQFVGAHVLANAVIHAFTNIASLRLGCLGFSVCIVCDVNRVWISKERNFKDNVNTNVN